MTNVYAGESERGIFRLMLCDINNLAFSQVESNAIEIEFQGGQIESNGGQMTFCPPNAEEA